MMIISLGTPLGFFYYWSVGRWVELGWNGMGCWLTHVAMVLSVLVCPFLFFSKKES